MGVTNSNKELSVSSIDCGGSFNIRLSLTAAPDITTNPTDIVLLLDRSGSMEGSPFASLKSGAKAFIDIIAESTGGAQTGEIGFGSRIGIVSFASTATQNTQLITSVADLKAAVDGLTAGGNTNHADAFEQGLALFDPASSNAKVMVMFTDGVTTTGSDPNTVATAAKAQGVVIYCIGLSGNGGIDEQALNDWASDPNSAYVVITPDDQELEEIFKDLARNISKPGATDVVIIDKVSTCFRVTSISDPTKGTASIIDDNTVEWKIDELGATQSEGATFEFTVEHVGSCSGLVEANESISYTDNEGNVVSFPSPEIEVECDENVCVEDCPAPVDIPVSGCSGTVEFDAGEISLDSLGRIVELDVTIKNVCPGKRVALAVLLNELDSNGDALERGIKFFTIPAHTGTTCRDVTVNCIRFVLPEDLNPTSTADNMCESRNLQAQFFANYIDGGFVCENQNT